MICKAWGGARGGTTLSVYGYHNDTYLVFYGSDLEHSATYYYYCCCCVLYATPHYTRNIVPHYLSICMGYVTALLLLS